MRRILGPLLVVLVVAVAVGAYWWTQVADTTTTMTFEDPAGPPPPPEDAAAATVNYVHDGDTIFLTTPDDPNLKVRLLAVDTPEVGPTSECFGHAARDHLRALLPEGATVYTAADSEPLDQYGRSLLFVWTADGALVNYDLVANGYAEAVFIGENRLYEPHFELAEEAAMDAGAGIWGNC